MTVARPRCIAGFLRQVKTVSYRKAFFRSKIRKKTPRRPLIRLLSVRKLGKETCRKAMASTRTSSLTRILSWIAGAGGSGDSSRAGHPCSFIAQLIGLETCDQLWFILSSSGDPRSLFIVNYILKT
jgi:hypothetical protein